MNKFNVIWKEAYFRNIKSPGFLFSLVMPLIMLAIFGFVTNLLSSEAERNAQATIGIVASDKTLLNNVVENYKGSLVLKATDDTQEAIKQLNAAETKGILSLVRDEKGTIVSVFNQVANSGNIDLSSVNLLLSQIQMSELAQKMNLSPNEVSTLVNSQVYTTVNKVDEKALENHQLVTVDEGNVKQFIRQGIAYIAVFLLYMFIVMFANMGGQEIASEKGTRMMEVILSSVDAKIHFLGKLFGITLVVMTMLFTYIGYAAVGLKFADTKFIADLLKGNDIMLLAGDLLVVTLIFLALGSIMFLALSAFAGSIVSKVEDVQRTMMPIVLVVILGFYLGMFALNAPHNSVVVISSFIPFLSPFVLPFRLAVGTVNIAELSTIIGLNIAFTVLVVWISIVFYKTNVLIYSDRGPLQVLKQSFVVLKSEKKLKD